MKQFGAELYSEIRIFRSFEISSLSPLKMEKFKIAENWSLAFKSTLFMWNFVTQKRYWKIVWKVLPDLEIENIKLFQKFFKEIYKTRQRNLQYFFSCVWKLVSAYVCVYVRVWLCGIYPAIYIAKSNKRRNTKFCTRYQINVLILI